jgi:hypothetical protein
MASLDRDLRAAVCVLESLYGSITAGRDDISKTIADTQLKSQKTAITTVGEALEVQKTQLRSVFDDREATIFSDPMKRRVEMAGKAACVTESAINSRFGST